MTMPAPETVEREALYVTDDELIRRLGVPAPTLRPVLVELESKYGFPKKSKLFGNRRYWPSVKLWLDRHNGIPVDA